MKAVTVVPEEPGSLSVDDVVEPRPIRGELLLRVQRVGVCGTDLDIVSGRYGEAPKGSPFLILGHESLSRVAELGPGVKGFKEGDLVVPTVRRNCPENCLNCRNGQSDMCLTGHYTEHGIKGLHGFASELAVTDAKFVVRLPEALSGVGVLLEPLTVAEKGILQAFLIQKARMRWKPRRAIVLGSGAVGLLATAILRLRGLEVTTVAMKPAKSRKARLASKTGAAYVDVEENPLSSMRGRFDLVFEATGATSVAVEARRLCGVNGVVAYVGIYPSDVAAQESGKSFTDLVLGNRLAFGSVNANITYFRQGTRDLMSIRSEWDGFLEGMVTDEVPIARGGEAYGPRGGDEVKVVLRVQ
jgi:glucose 1-dehydrogenase